MSTQEESGRNKGFEFCQSFMNQCCNPGPAEEKGERPDFKSCEQMIKQFCETKDGKFDFEACMSKMAQCCKDMNEKSNEKVNN